MTASNYMLQPILPSICKAKEHLETGPSSNTDLLGTISKLVPLNGDQVKLSIRREMLGMEAYTFAYKLFISITPLLLGGGYTLTDASQIEHGQNGFDRGVYLRCGKEVRASFQWGGRAQLGWCLLHINGGLCKLMPHRYWVKLMCLAKRLKARLGTFDLAGDDYTGLLGYNPYQVRDSFLACPGQFIPSHRKGAGSIAPKLRKWIESATGATIYLGGEKASIQHRIYEKGKQLQDRKRPDWVRWEVMFRRTGGKTELSLGLLYPGNWPDAWLGSCHHLEIKFKRNGGRFIMGVDKARRGSQELAARALLTLEKQWGGVIEHLVRVMGVEAFCEQVARPVESSPLADLDESDMTGILELREELRAAPDSAAGAAAAQAKLNNLSSLQHRFIHAWRHLDLNNEDDTLLLNERMFYRLGYLEDLAGTNDLPRVSDVDKQAAAIGLEARSVLDLAGGVWIYAREIDQVA